MRVEREDVSWGEAGTLRTPHGHIQRTRNEESVSLIAVLVVIPWKPHTHAFPLSFARQ